METIAKPESRAEVLELAFSLARLKCNRLHERPLKWYSGFDISLANDAINSEDNRSSRELLLIKVCVDKSDDP
jgi:hypothetical protein